MTRHTVTNHSRFGQNREWETLPVLGEQAYAPELRIEPGLLILSAVFALGIGAGFVGGLLLGGA